MEHTLRNFEKRLFFSFFFRTMEVSGHQNWYQHSLKYLRLMLHPTEEKMSQ